GPTEPPWWNSSNYRSSRRTASALRNIPKKTNNIRPLLGPLPGLGGGLFFLSETASRNASATNDPPSGFCTGQDYTPHSTCDSWHVRLLKVPLDRHRRKSS